jgi:phospholipase/carboxylesterase
MSWGAASTATYAADGDYAARNMTLQSHVHLLIPGADPTAAPFVVLHGSGGSEHDLVPLAAELAPTVTILAVRGTLPFEGGNAFFQRFADRSIDEADIRERSLVLADFIESAASHYRFARGPITLGFSNGAIMAAALLLMRPGLLSAAVLLRPLSPFLHDPPARIPATPVIIIDGAKDSRRSPGDGHLLAERLAHAGARVSHHVLPVGHSITALDRQLVSKWLATEVFVQDRTSCAPGKE